VPVLFWKTTEILPLLLRSTNFLTKMRLSVSAHLECAVSHCQKYLLCVMV